MYTSPLGLPTVAYAFSLGYTAGGGGFDWAHIKSAFTLIEETVDSGSQPEGSLHCTIKKKHSVGIS